MMDDFEEVDYLGTSHNLGIPDPDGRVLSFALMYRWLWMYVGCTSIYRYGDWGNHLEIRTEHRSRRILDLEVLYVDRIENREDLRRPGFWEVEGLRECTRAFLHRDLSEFRTVSLFRLNLLGRELDIVFQEDPPEKYHRYGRIQFYYNRENTLIYIKIVDLRDEEAAHFRRYVRSR